MASFATPDELATYLGVDASVFDDARAQSVLDTATAEIQNYTRQLIEQATDATRALFGNGLGVLRLPELPVVSLGDVSLDGTLLVADTDYRLEPGGQLRRLPAPTFPWLALCGPVWPLGGQVVVDAYAHGYAPIPDDVRGVCLRVASRAYRNPEALAEQSITNYAVQYGRYPGSGAALSEADTHLLDRYRQDL